MWLIQKIFEANVMRVHRGPKKDAVLMELPAPITGVALGKDQTRAVVVDHKSGIGVWNLTTGKPIAKGKLPKGVAKEGSSEAPAQPQPPGGTNPFGGLLGNIEPCVDHLAWGSDALYLVVDKTVHRVVFDDNADAGSKAPVGSPDEQL